MTRNPAPTSAPPRRRLLRWLRLLGALLLLAVGLAGHLAPVARAQAAGGGVYVVQIHGEIDLGLAPYLARVLDEAERTGASAVILDLDTPGGRLDAALQMRQTILDSPVRTIAFVNRTAFSAGALLTIAAHEIYLAPGAAVGAATPVTGAGEAADEKTVSAVRTTFRATAEARGRDPRLAEAMVDPRVVVEGLDDGEHLLSLSATDARAWGYADGLTETRQDVLAQAGLAGAAVQETTPALAENVVRFITNPAVASLLISIGLLLILAETLAGGSGFAAATGLAMLAVFFWGHMLAGLAGWEGVALVGLGLALLALEVFVIPGFGIAGVLGIVSLGGGLFLSMIGGEIVTSADLIRAASTVGLAVLLTFVGGGVLLWLLMRTGRTGGLVLQARLGTADRPAARAADRGPDGSGGRLPAPLVVDTPLDGASGRASGERADERGALNGARGVALSDLRPGGIAQVHGVRVDVVTQGEYLPAGTTIEVLRDEGYRRVVRRLEGSQGQAPRAGVRPAT